MKKTHDATASTDALSRNLLAHELQQWRDVQPEPDSNKELIGRLMHVQSLTHQRLNAALLTYDLTYYEYSVLAALRDAGAPWSLSPSALKTALLFTSGGLSNLLKRLEKRHFITRESNPDDGRGVLVHLTPTGRKTVQEAMPSVAAVETQLVRSLNARERVSLTRLLSRICSAKP